MADSAGVKQLLHVGCGTKTIDNLPAFFQSGWRETRLDINPDVAPDIVASLTDLSAVESGGYDAVWSSHNVEHVFHHEATEVCRAFRRVLRGGGFAVITCPDLRTAMEIGAKKGLDATIYDSPIGPITPRDMLFGHQRSIARGNTYMAHRNGFDLTSLRDVLVAAGFQRTFGVRVQYDLWFIAGDFAGTDAARTQLGEILERTV
ncbi:MAG: methyltransferase domain-containing protein [Rhodobacter sp.]|nr:methyltransferase domain-containing protein [Rhodobacter sp.]